MSREEEERVSSRSSAQVDGGRDNESSELSLNGVCYAAQSICGREHFQIIKKGNQFIDLTIEGTEERNRSVTSPRRQRRIDSNFRHCEI